MQKNYKQIYAIERANKEKILKVCPECPERSGIYVFYRQDEESGLKFAYVGQAKSLLNRCAQHLREYDHIALSLKKRGLYDAVLNPYGWALMICEQPIEKLDEAEIRAIKQQADAGYQLFNKTAGSQASGKVIFDNKKSPKNYHDGIKQGEKNITRFIKDLFEKHLDYTTKKQPPTKLQEKAIKKFKDFLEAGNE